MQDAAILLLAISGLACMLRGLFLLYFRVPVPGTILFDGYKQAMRARDAAIFLTERAPRPWMVQDLIAFTTREGRAMRVTVTVMRWDAPFGRELLVWYSPKDPRRIAIVGPLRWAVWSAGLVATAAWLSFT
jgi:hypothetical protein